MANSRLGVYDEETCEVFVFQAHSWLARPEGGRMFIASIRKWFGHGAIATRPRTNSRTNACLRMFVAGSLSFVATIAVCLDTNGQEASGAPKLNRLSQSTSPYLRAHADNPIDWYPWGAEALAKAKRENKIILLSIGYSTCHWCHVMERESFHDEQIARVLNEHFVCIKVDREEHPEVDHMYMTALSVFQQLSGSGGGTGWPLTMFLTPDGEPFFGGTYFPPRDGQRGFMVGFLTIIQRVHEIWKTREAQVRQDARTIARITRVRLENQPMVLGGPPQDPASWRRLWDSVEQSLAEQFDPEYGGFGYHPQMADQPKFPEPTNLMYLLDRLRRLQHQGADQIERTKKLLGTTLTRMALGGIRDHVGGGFHRYSVDRFWRVPHFEKMLYDNAQLLSIYAQAAVLFGDPLYREVAGEIGEFLLNEMRAPEGAFYAAIDADSEGEEGRYYVWELREIQSIVPAETLETFMATFQLNQPPAFDHQRYVLYLGRPWEQIAQERGLPLPSLREQVQAALAKLRQQRATRPKPSIDTKILASWNGMAIRGLVDAAQYLEKPEWLQEAERAAEFVLTHLVAEDGSLNRCYSMGEATRPGCLDDYVFLIDGLLALAKATGQERWYDAAMQLQRKQDALFWHQRNGGYFFVSEAHPQTLGRTKIWIDNVTPSGNAIAARNLLALAEKTHDTYYRERAAKLLNNGAFWLDQAPAAVPVLATAVADFYITEVEKANK